MDPTAYILSLLEDFLGPLALLLIIELHRVRSASDCVRLVGKVITGALGLCILAAAVTVICHLSNL